MGLSTQTQDQTTEESKGKRNRMKLFLLALLIIRKKQPTTWKSKTEASYQKETCNKIKMVTGPFPKKK
jgi:diacylglycerol kinase family enzyme